MEIDRSVPPMLLTIDPLPGKKTVQDRNFTYLDYRYERKLGCLLASLASSPSSSCVKIIPKMVESTLFMNTLGWYFGVLALVCSLSIKLTFILKFIGVVAA